MIDLVVAGPLGASDASSYIAGAAAILGALVGGAVSACATYLVEKQSHKHQEVVREKQDLDVARGIARVLSEDFIRATSQLRMEQTHGGWFAHLGDKRHASMEERQLLYRHLHTDEYVDVSVGLAMMDVIAQQREAALSSDPETAESLFSDWNDEEALLPLMEGRFALTRLSDVA
jgi:hypothetical protein